MLVCLEAGRALCVSVSDLTTSLQECADYLAPFSLREHAYTMIMLISMCGKQPVIPVASRLALADSPHPPQTFKHKWTAVTETQAKNGWLRSRWRDLYNDNMWVVHRNAAYGGWLTSKVHASCMGPLPTATCRRCVPRVRTRQPPCTNMAQPYWPAAAAAPQPIACICHRRPVGSVFDKCIV